MTLPRAVMHTGLIQFLHIIFFCPAQQMISFFFYIRQQNGFSHSPACINDTITCHCYFLQRISDLCLFFCIRIPAKKSCSRNAHSLFAISSVCIVGNCIFPMQLRRQRINCCLAPVRIFCNNCPIFCCQITECSPRNCTCISPV